MINFILFGLSKGSKYEKDRLVKDSNNKKVIGYINRLLQNYGLRWYLLDMLIKINQMIIFMNLICLIVYMKCRQIKGN